MRFIKLFLCFAAILAAIIGLVFISSGSDDHAVAGVNSAYYNECDSIIKADWADNSNWSMAQYDKSKKRLKVRKDELGTSGHNALLAELNVFAVASVLNTAAKEYTDSKCRESRIKELKKDMDFLVANTQVSSSSNDVKMFNSLYKLYDKALKLSRDKFDFETKYKRNGEYGKRWVDIEKRLTSKSEERDKILNDYLYGSISNIDVIKKGLVYEFNNRIADSKTAFINKLSNEICWDFSKDLPTEFVEYVDNSFDLEGVIKKEKIELEKVYQGLVNIELEFSQDFGKNENISSLINNFERALDQYDRIIERSEQVIDNMNNQY